MIVIGLIAFSIFGVTIAPVLREIGDDWHRDAR